MTGTSSGTAYSTYTDERLLDLLITEEDRLPRAAVDEFLARGERMVGPLTRICQDERAWREADQLFWRPIHATLILGTIGGERALPGLLASLQYSTVPEDDIDWAHEWLPSLFADIGASAIAPLLERSRTVKPLSLERYVAFDAIARLAERLPGWREELLDFLRAVADSRAEPDDARQAAAAELLPFARPDDRELLEDTARRAEEGEDIPRFDRRDVRDAYRKLRKPPADAVEDPLRFYDPGEIQARQRRWRHEEEEERWSRLADGGDRAKIDAEIRRLIAPFEATLRDLSQKAATDALWVAETMSEYAVYRERRPPWGWDIESLNGYIHYFIRDLGPNRRDSVASAGDHVLRFITYWKSEGRIDADEAEDVRELIRDRREALVAGSLDPEGWTAAGSLVEEALAEGVDIGNPAGFRRWVCDRVLRAAEAKDGLRFIALGRNDPCPCGSGKKFKKCCES